MRAAPITVSTLALLLSTTPVQAQLFQRCDHTRAITNRVALAQGEALRIEAGAGSLTVRGVDGLREARISGTACASSAALLDDLAVAVTRSANGIRVETRFPDRPRFNEQARIDLVLEVPTGTATTVTDGSGDVEISGVGELTVHDGSGDLTLEDIRGGVNITDGSGGVFVRGITGDVRLEDGSGELDVADVGGTVRIVDGSGSIDVRDVRGDLIVSNAGSGDLSWGNVSGRVSVPSRGRERPR